MTQVITKGFSSVAIKTYKAFLVQQRAKSTLLFAVFVAQAKDVDSWSHADSIKLDRSGVQRALVESRWKQIGRFFSASNENVIPTNVTIAFSEEVSCVNSLDDLSDGKKGYFIDDKGDGLVEISFPDTVKDVAYIIDGQHRLRGMSSFPEPIVIPICLLLSASKVERAFQFVTINNKSHKVPTDNLKALISNFSNIEGELQKRLRQSSISVPKLAGAIDFLNEDATSPFHKMVNWVNNRFEDKKALVAPAALENSIRALQRAFPDEAGDEAEAAELFSDMWTRIFKLTTLTLATAEEQPNLLKKATIQAITEMIVDKVRNDYDPAFSDGESLPSSGLGDAAAKLVVGLPAWFWKEDWELKSLDTSAGRDIIKADLRNLKVQISKQRSESEIKSQLMLYRKPTGEVALAEE